MKVYKHDFYYPNSGSEDAYLFHEGTNYRSYRFLGAHPVESDSNAVRFAVWAPNAKYVNLIGDFNQWNEYDLPLRRIEGTGIWQIVVYNVEVFDAYKYRIVGPNNEIRYKADPYAFHAEERPKSASKYYPLKDFQWDDQKWLKAKNKKDVYNSPMSIYEVNLSSWKRKEDNQLYSYRELAGELVPYVYSMGYTHVEFMPITEYPYDGSWGYQSIGYFAPTSRFGTPEDFMALVNEFHKKNIGVILDWVPVHFCSDDHGLARFDGSNCYEWQDEYRADNNQWGTRNFDFSKPEVQSFLISSALYWKEYYHIDGFRVDAVAYMLYLNFTGKDLKNAYGGTESLEAISFLRKLNEVIFREYPDILMIAEESTAWPLVTAPTRDGGLGFNFKWNMGWMNDILEYIKLDPIYRKDHQNALTFTMTYCFSENYILPFSHDEVVHGKLSLINKIPGSYEDKFASLKLLYAYMFAHPGKKLLFMGDEFGQFIEWNEWTGLDWLLLDYPMHRGVQSFVQELNRLYRKNSCLYEIDTNYSGFEWIEHENYQESIIAFERINKKGNRLVCIFNFTPVERKIYPIGVTQEGRYKVVLNTAHKKYCGWIERNKPYYTSKEPIHGREYRLTVDIPALSSLWLEYQEEKNNRREGNAGKK